MKISVVSGGFDPIHSGHIKYFNSARKLSDKLIVLLNSDLWLQNKKGKFFMEFNERKIILESLNMVDEVLDFEDDDVGSCINGLEKIKGLYPNDNIIFCNGGDRHEFNVPERKVKGIKFKFNVGGENKLNSSSWLLKNYQFNKEDRVWGKFYNLFEDHHLKVKELIIQSNRGMSFQRHFHRNEIWFVSKGQCLVKYAENDPEDFKYIQLHQEETFKINQGSWHQIINDSNEDCHIIEIQYGEETIEEDIERLYYFDGDKN